MLRISSSNSFFDRVLTKVYKTRPSIGFVFFLAVVPGLIVGGVLSAGIYQNERKNFEETAMQTARALSKAVDSEIFAIRNQALALAKSEHLEANNFYRFWSQAKSVAKATNVGYSIILTDTSGQQIVNTAESFPLPKQYNSRPEDLLRVKTNNAPFLSEIFVGALLQRPIFTLSVPVTVGDKFQYMLSIGSFPETFNKIFSRQSLDSEWVATLIDRSGNVVARSLHPKETVGEKVPLELFESIEKSKEGGVTIRRLLDGAESFTVYHTSQDTNWTVAVAITHRAILSRLFPLSALVVMCITALMLCGGFMVYTLRNHVQKSIGALNDAMTSAANGDLDARAPVSGVFELAELAETFNRMLETRIQMEEQIRQMAFHDSLTGLANRNLIYDRIQLALSSSRRTGQFCAILFLDMDNFKPLNDEHGHHVGDMLLVEVASRLKSHTRESDTVGRLGGDEFILLLTDLGANESIASECTKQISEQIHRVLSLPYLLQESAQNVTAEAVHYECTVTIGACVFTYHDGIDVSNVLTAADAAMYDGKRNGRNVVQVVPLSHGHDQPLRESSLFANRCRLPTRC